MIQRPLEPQSSVLPTELMPPYIWCPRKGLNLHYVHLLRMARLPFAPREHFVPMERIELSKGFPTSHPKCDRYTIIRVHRRQCTPDRTRTDTGLTTHKPLKLVRLPFQHRGVCCGRGGSRTHTSHSAQQGLSLSRTT